MKKLNRAYLVHRVLVRLEQQIGVAYQYGRMNDAMELGKLVGRLEYLHFQAVGFEGALDNA